MLIFVCYYRHFRAAMCICTDGKYSSVIVPEEQMCTCLFYLCAGKGAYARSLPHTYRLNAYVPGYDMEEKKTGRAHSFAWRDRKQGNVTGVKDVLSFVEHSVILETEQGMMTIKGKDLHIGRLLLEQGEVEMEGTIDSIVYSGSNPAKKGSLVKRMFR